MIVNLGQGLHQLLGLWQMNWWQTLAAFLDIVLVAYFFYRLFLLIQGTQAVELLKGIFILLLGTILSAALHLDTIHWLLQTILMMLLVALPIVFQPELRRALEHLGRGGFFAPPNWSADQGTAGILEEVVGAVETLTRGKTGAIIVLEREVNLQEYVATGIGLDASVSAELLVNVFVPGTPLHDGAVIIRGGRVVAAACFLPLTGRTGLGSEYGGRHRAALGLAECSDAMTLVVSEETGTISLGVEGRLIRHLEPKALRQMLQEAFPRRSKPRDWWPRGYRIFWGGGEAPAADSPRGHRSEGAKRRDTSGGTTCDPGGEDGGGPGREGADGTGGNGMA